jgi:hypothetical protein
MTPWEAKGGKRMRQVAMGYIFNELFLFSKTSVTGGECSSAAKHILSMQKALDSNHKTDPQTKMSKSTKLMYKRLCLDII